MAKPVKKSKATATWRQASAKEVKVAEVAKPTTAVRKGIELVAKAELPREAEAAVAPTKAATKKENIVAISHTSHTKVMSREMIEQVAYAIWVQRGYQHGYALEDWIRAEQELLKRAS